MAAKAVQKDDICTLLSLIIFKWVKVTIDIEENL